MAAAKRKSIAKLCIALGLFILAGFFRQLDRVTAPLPSCRLLSADQPDLYRFGHGVGIFHIAPNPASKQPAMATAGLCDGRAVAVSARG